MSRLRSASASLPRNSPSLRQLQLLPKSCLTFATLVVLLSAVVSVCSAKNLTLHGRSSYGEFSYPEPTLDSGLLNVKFVLRSELGRNALLAALVPEIPSESITVLLKLIDSQLQLDVITSAVSQVHRNKSKNTIGSQLLTGPQLEARVHLWQTHHGDKSAIQANISLDAGANLNVTITIQQSQGVLLQKSGAKLYIGGLPSELSSMDNAGGFPSLVGCVENVRFDGSSEAQSPSGYVGILGRCDFCQASLCQSGTQCFPRAAAAGCNCASKGKVGRTCTQGEEFYLLCPYAS